MNLYELAHHPLCSRKPRLHPEYRWPHVDNTTHEQFELLSACIPHPDEHTDENEFRMHLLFVHWATLPPTPQGYVNMNGE